MTVRTRAQLNSDIDSTITTNGTGAITGAIVNSRLGDLADSAVLPEDLGSNVATFLGAPSSANLRAALTDETGTGGAVFATSPVITTPALTDPVITGAIAEDTYTITDGAAFEIDPGNGTIQQITLGASRTPKATNMVNGESVTLKVADGTAYTITWTDATFGGSGVVWTGGAAPTLATTGWTWIELWKQGGQVYGARVGDTA